MGFYILPYSVDGLCAFMHMMHMIDSLIFVQSLVVLLAQKGFIESLIKVFVIFL